ncbi:hypothetical protein W02_04370 [Nitrospira sp. KM1]|uniref:hypothetical protein n=1 Tax=Nitrospira sp. KM1 TaxID=1936990 RepID=UPI0013A72E74|nr:hypothetical protein [Nitrospira sp. KM1]BCA53297.1 hypothetical protein W02_04370 [Nitrospira sp. KM1]
MKATEGPHVLFYPFHLCHQDTLDRLLIRFQSVHFRDFMALKLTPLAGLTAFEDRMGDHLPELVAAGRIVQGYDVSGALSPEVESAVDRDLSDPVWRTWFHAALSADRRFQRGLSLEAPPASMIQGGIQAHPFSVREIRAGSGQAANIIGEGRWDYGLALVKTSAALVYTYRLALMHGLQVATDSSAHYALFERSCCREGIRVPNHLLTRVGY